LPAILICSCKKKHENPFANDSRVEGKWKLVSVADNAGGPTETKPSAYSTDVEMQLTYTGNNGNGTMVGKTISNTFTGGSFVTSRDGSFASGAFILTANAETAWGNLFIQNISSSRTYSFDSMGRLMIVTTVKTLLFEKI
jgi:Ca2+-binding RTX toxin-like protein